MSTKIDLLINLKTAKGIDEVIKLAADVAYWPKTDIPTATTNVRFRG